MKLSELMRDQTHGATMHQKDDWADEVEQLESTNTTLLEALQVARDAIGSLDDTALGIATGSDGYQWPIKNELLLKINKAIRKATA